MDILFVHGYKIEIYEFHYKISSFESSQAPVNISKTGFNHSILS